MQPLVDLLYQEIEVVWCITELSVNAWQPVYFSVCSATLLSALDIICDCASHSSTGRIPASIMLRALCQMQILLLTAICIISVITSCCSLISDLFMNIFNTDLA